MKHLLLILFTVASVLGEQAALKEQALPAIKAKILIPEGWFTKEESDDGVTVYQVSREKAENEEDVFSAGLILSVTNKVPDRASMKPSEYASDLLSSAQDEGDGAKLQRTEEGPFQCLRLEYTIESDQGNIKVINLAKANDSTGTLYFATWQSPEKEEPQLKELREAVLASMKFDPTF
jgi:PsbP